jgi:alpha-galactosidase
MGRCRPPLATLVAALVVTCLLLSGGVRLRGDEPLAQSDTAFVTQDEGGGWTIGNELIHYSLGRQGATVGVRAIADMVNGLDWHRNADPDSFVTLNGQRIVIGSSATAFQRASADEWWGGVRLDLTYRIASVPINITRSYAAYPGSSTIETWTTFQTTGTRSVTLSDLTNFSFTLENGNLRWIRGLDVSDEEGGPFTLSSGDLDDGQVFEIGADRRASEQNMPWLALSAWTSEEEDAQPDAVAHCTQFFGSILWSGSWRARIHRQGDHVTMQMGLPGFTTTLGAGAALETPHAIFGTINQLMPTASMAVRTFVERGVRHGRPLRALVTYNTAYSYGIFIDEQSLRAEMELAAQMGFEQFVVDAGWWVEPDPENSGDFVHDWGNWEVDAERFPSGLGALTDYAHELGMRFGVWVEPERVDRSTVGQPGLAKERFLATDDGRYESGVANRDSISGQICLADPEARAWILDKLYEFLDAVHPDYLKWDNNFWVNCNRPTHGHGTEDGNYQHMRALRDVLGDLRERYPDMDIEDCAGGGHRMSLDILAYADATWVDDRSTPSSRVRHNLEGLSQMFPAAYLSSFVMGADNEPMDFEPPPNDFALLLRSRMLGVFGASSRIADMSEATRNKISTEIALYKLIRPILREGGSILLGRQVMDFPGAGWSGWDAIEQVAPASGEAVVFGFRSSDGPSSAIVKPRGLRPEASYDVESADFGRLGTVTGADLMRDGLELDASGLTQSHVLIFRIHKDESDGSLPQRGTRWRRR